jgi:hypothetical protein
MADSPDHAMLMESLLQKLQAGVQLSADEQKVLVEELEPVAWKYQHAVYRFARKAIRNVRRPYLLYHHCVMLGHLRSMIDDAIADSPSLAADANEQVAEAWARETDRDALLDRVFRDITPISTLDGLLAAIDAKILAGRLQATSGNMDYINARRVPQTTDRDVRAFYVGEALANSRLEGACPEEDSAFMALTERIIDGEITPSQAIEQLLKQYDEAYLALPSDKQRE